MSRPTTIQQPGPPADERIVAVAGPGKAISFDLQPGILLVDAVRRGFAAAGFTSGVVELADVALSPFAYVMPALSKTGENAAFYSDIFRPAGVSRIKTGAMTFGIRDGVPFFHCHALWREPDGKVSGGHILPEETFVAEQARVTALGVAARFEALPDREINFKVFAPYQTATTGASGPTIAVRLRPNQDFCGALEGLCARFGIEKARVRGGVGSTIGARFTDGREVENFATEVYVKSGLVQRGADGQWRADVDVGLVDYTGAMAEGILQRGENPVLMTFELALEVL